MENPLTALPPTPTASSRASRTTATEKRSVRACVPPSSEAALRRYREGVIDLRPVTPEVAGSSRVGPANLKHSRAATSAAFVFLRPTLKNWRLAKSLAMWAVLGRKNAARNGGNVRDVSHFGASVPRKKLQRAPEIGQRFGGGTAAGAVRNDRASVGLPGCRTPGRLDPKGDQRRHAVTDPRLRVET